MLPYEWSFCKLSLTRQLLRLARFPIISQMCELDAWMFEAKPGQSGFLIYMIVRTILNICGSHVFRYLLHPSEVSLRESSSVKEGHFTKDSEHVFSRNKCVYELYSPIILTVVIGALFHGERVLCELSLTSLLLQSIITQGLHSEIGYRYVIGSFLVHAA